MTPSDDEGPTGPKRRGTSPGSDLEDIAQQAKDQFRQVTRGRGLRGVAIYAVLALVGIGGWTSYYTVPSDSVAILQRFGKYQQEVPPGLHFKLPLGIDRATIVPVKRQLKQEF